MRAVAIAGIAITLGCGSSPRLADDAGFDSTFPDTGDKGKFCQPVTASCTCSAGMAGAMRSCANSNLIGTCLGTQTCSASGWSACTAATATAEVCDGIDNDCNFVIDNGVGGGEACTNTVA